MSHRATRWLALSAAATLLLLSAACSSDSDVRIMADGTAAGPAEPVTGPEYIDAGTGAGASSTTTAAVPGPSTEPSARLTGPSTEPSARPTSSSTRSPSPSTSSPTVPGPPSTVTTAPPLRPTNCIDPAEFQVASRTPEQGRSCWTRIPAASIAGRVDHGAVWTGSEMVVWGGNAPLDRDFADGAAWNPTAGKWRKMADSPLSSRRDPTVVWTGTEVLVWSGYQSYQTMPLPDGAAWNPVTDTWRPITPLPSSAPRGHTAAWVAGRLVVWGGEGGSLGWEYDPEADEWRQMPPSGLPPLRPRGYDYIAVSTGTELLVWIRGEDYWTSRWRGAAYNPATGSWTAVASAPVLDKDASSLHYTPFSKCTTWTGSQVITPMFGHDMAGQATRGWVAYDRAADTWADLPTAPDTCNSASVAVWAGDRMISAGGFDRPTTAGGLVYFPGERRWEVLVGPQLERVHASAVWSGTEMLLWGGGDVGEDPNQRQPGLNTGVAWRPASG